MKKILFAICLLSAAAAMAQSANLSTRYSDPQFTEFTSHPAQAAYAAMAQEHSVLASSGYTMASGERRASDFAQPEAVSLGAVARELKKQHDAQPKKSRVVWIN